MPKVRRSFTLAERELRILSRSVEGRGMSLSEWGAERLTGFSRHGWTEARPQEELAYVWQVLLDREVLAAAEVKAASRGVTLREVLRAELDSCAWGMAQAAVDHGLGTPTCPRCVEREMVKGRGFWYCRPCNTAIWPGDDG